MPGKVLIVDDSQSTRMLLAGIVRQLGVEVIEAANGEEGLARCAAAWPLDVVLLDWHMQPTDGPALLAALRKDERFSRVNVIMVTAESSADCVREVARLGIAGYILKPFNRQLVAERLAALGLGSAPAAPAAPAAQVGT